MDNDANTVAPLDGDGHNVVGADVYVNPSAVAPDNVRAEDYSTQGRTTVATAPGFAFAPHDNDLPLITSKGVDMTREQADAVVKEAEGTRAGVHIVSNTDDNEED